MKPEIVASVSERLKFALDKRGMTQTDLFKLTGIDKGSISSYVTGRYEPKDDRIYIMATALKVNPIWLSGFNVPMTEREAVEREDALLADFVSLSEKGKQKVIDFMRMVKNDEKQ